jgi:hypothetical protein
MPVQNVTFSILRQNVIVLQPAAGGRHEVADRQAGAMVLEYMIVIYASSAVLMLALLIIFCCHTQRFCAVIDAALSVVCFNSCCKCCTKSVPISAAKVTAAWLTTQLQKENILPKTSGRRVVGVTPKFVGESEKGMTSERKALTG